MRASALARPRAAGAGRTQRTLALMTDCYEYLNLGTRANRINYEIDVKSSYFPSTGIDVSILQILEYL